MANKTVTAAQQQEADRIVGEALREQIGRDRAKAEAGRKAAAAEKRRQRLSLTVENEDGSTSTQDDIFQEAGTIASELLNLAANFDDALGHVVVCCMARRIGYLIERAAEATGEPVGIRNWNGPMYSAPTKEKK